MEAWCALRSRGFPTSHQQELMINERIKVSCLRSRGLAATLATSTAGCGILESDPWDERRERRERQMDRWAAHQITSYSHTLSDMLRQAIDQRAYSFQVEYQPDFGFPRLINLDWDGQMV